MSSPLYHNTNVPIRSPLHRRRYVRLRSRINNVLRQTANATPLFRSVAPRLIRQTRIVRPNGVINRFRARRMPDTTVPPFVDRVTRDRRVERRSVARPAGSRRGNGAD